MPSRPRDARERFVSHGPQMKSVVDASKRNGMSALKRAFDVRSRSSAPTRLPAALTAIIFSSVRRGTSSSERNEPADANEPSHIATLFVAFAETEGTPIERRTGNEMKLPPPAPALIALATKAAIATSARCWSVRSSRRRS
jgi:hypothetical protein